MNNWINKIGVLCFAMLLTGFLFAQEHNYVLGEESKVFIEGTSTLHDWKAEVEEIEGGFHFSDSFFKKKIKVGSEAATADLKFVVESFESGRGATMNKKMRNALKNADHPHVTFTTSGPATVTQILDKDAGKYQLTAKGTLEMAGSSKEVEIVAEVTQTSRRANCPQQFYSIKNDGL